MKLLDDNVLAEVADDIEALGELAEDNKDFLKGLEKKAAEVESDEEN